MAGSWNPLRCSGTALPPNVLLAAKLVALCLLGLNLPARLLSEPPLAAAFAGSALALIFNRRARLSAFLLGATLLASDAVIGFGGHLPTLLGGGFLLLVAVEPSGREPAWTRAGIALAYLASAFLLWQAMERHQPGPEHAAVLTLLILIQAAIGCALLFERSRTPALWLGVLFHVAAPWLAADNLSIMPLDYVFVSTYPVLAAWPKRRLTVLYDGDCGFCETTRRFFERLDFDHIYDWHPFQGGAGDKWAIPTPDLERAAHVVGDGRIYAGFRAFQAITLYNPLTYFILAALLLTARAVLPAAQPVIAVLAITLYFPLFRPLGEAVYQLIARNRHRLPGEKTCKVA